MNKTTRNFTLILAGCFMLGSVQPAQSQLWKRIKDRVQETADNHVVDESGDITNKTMDAAEKRAGKAIDKGKGAGPDGEDAAAHPGKGAPVADYRSYDFVPGDKIIFQPDLRSEPDAELPARFTLNEGNAEIQTYEGEKFLHVDAGSHEVVSPLMNSDHYLPEQFTMEFDIMYENNDDYFRYSNSFEVQFRKRGDANYGNYPMYKFSVENNGGAIWGVSGTHMVRFPDPLDKSMHTNNLWHHVAIYVRGQVGKVYIDQYRVAASNTLPAGAGHVSFSGDAHYGFKIKNVRIAAGGEDKYNKVVTDGKFVTHGILFDVNKSIIKPESMGTLNDIAKLMEDHSDLKFEIHGHTDGDGSADANRKLSQERADAVKVALIRMGIDETRLAARGFGETAPVDSNDTAEGKANNRRVEFVKM
jgi:outer membrane protein OmpA-like peptidoglycan-associated protein